MNLENKHYAVIELLYNNLKDIAPQELGVRLSTMTDEQPHLMGFIFNLVDDFEEDEHQELVKTSLVVRDVFVSAGMPVSMINSSKIDEVIESELERFNTFGEESLDLYMAESASPELLKAVWNKVAFFGQDEANAILIINIIIRLMEEAAGKKEEE